VNVDLLAASASKLYRHAQESVFFLVVSSKRILMRSRQQGCLERGKPLQNQGASYRS
jgi:hypothetical protein